MIGVDNHDRCPINVNEISNKFDLDDLLVYGGLIDLSNSKSNPKYIQLNQSRCDFYIEVKRIAQLNNN